MAVEDESGIAIVGMSCRFPGAGNVAQFWQNLATGVESIARFTDEQLRQAGVPAAHLENPNYVKAAPILDEPAAFDASFFGYTPMEARHMDPQHRILLELAHEAMEDAGCDPSRFPGRIGVFTGSAMNTYFMHSGQNRHLAEDYIPTLIVNDKDFLSTRISYKLNLKGPSLTVQTACSTSLVAIHLACQSLLSQESDLALAGAISVRVPHKAGYFCDSGGVVSPDAKVRAFDAGANGTVFGSGGGMIVLKRLADALAEGDVVHAVIKGSAVNNDGSEKAGYTAPSVNSQADAAVEAMANAGVNAEDISYIEAHGSGTPVGDPIEIAALTQAFRSFTSRLGYCAIGSVKTNLGHLDAAAGIAGVIKTVLALQHRQLPPSLNYHEPNPEIDFPSTPFYVNTRLAPWTSRGPRRAGVVATGMGGTNAHLILEEAPARLTSAPSGLPALLVWSAKSEAALDAGTNRLSEHLRMHPSLNLDEVAHTLQSGRKHFARRQVLVVSQQDEAIAILSERNSRRIGTSTISSSTRQPLVLLLPGIGDQYVGMAHELYETSAFFRQEVDLCAQLLQRHLSLDIREIIYPKSGAWKQVTTKGIDLKRMLGKTVPSSDLPESAQLNHILYAQPALFTIEYALGRFWQHVGISFDAIVGHSMGEYVAACLAEVISLEDALYLIVRRTKLVSQLPVANMLAVALSENELIPLLSRNLSISLINGPQLCVVAGPEQEMAALVQLLEGKEVIHRPIQNTHAFHSRLLDPIVHEFEASVREVYLRAPKTPFISNVTGTWITNAEATDPAYWSRHLNRTARFDEALQTLWRMENPILLEAGPGRTLGVLAMQHPAKANGSTVPISSLRHDYEQSSDLKVFLEAVGKLWLRGREIDWKKLPGANGHQKAPLPTYNFERQHYWIESPTPEMPLAASEILPTSIEEWFYVPSWERTVFYKATSSEMANGKILWLVFTDRPELAAPVQNYLKNNGAAAQVVQFSEEFQASQNGPWHLRPAQPSDYVSLFTNLRERAYDAIHIIYLGPTGEAGFFSLRGLVQAIGETGVAAPVAIGIITNETQEVTGNENLEPKAAILLSLCEVIPKEYPNVTCFTIDLPFAVAIGLENEVVARISAEFFKAKASKVIAYRGKHRWTKSFQHVYLPPANSGRPNQLRSRGVYLITGGTGGIGLVIARYLAETCQAKLVLTKRTAFPDRSQWGALLHSNDTSRSLIKLIKELQEIERLGAEVEVIAADVSSRSQMENAIRQTLVKFGAINGVIHAAGVIEAALLQAATPEMTRTLFAPKVQGTLVLHELLEAVELDFLVLFSSMASITNLFAYSDYSAANAFLDAFAPYSKATRRYHTVAINWPVWKEVGMGSNLDAYMGIEQWKDEALKRAILNKDGLDVFARALDSDLAQVIVSPENLSDVLARAASAIKPSRSARRAAGIGRGADKADVETIVSRFWSDVLGLEDIGVDEVFLELGGHSLLAMQIVSRIKATYKVAFTLKDFFQGPTIGQLSRLIRERTGVETPAPREESERQGTITPLARTARRMPKVSLQG